MPQQPKPGTTAEQSGGSSPDHLRSNSHRRQPGVGGGFSLIELLVVISIVAVLAGMLMSSISMAKSASQKTVCASNMRQLGIGLSAYATDNKGYMAFAYATIPGLPWSGGPLFEYYQDNYQAGSPIPDRWYSGVGINGCPTHTSVVLGAGPLTTRYYSYLMNQSLVGHNPSSAPTRMSQISVHSTKVLMVESAVGNMCEFGSPAWMNVAARGYLWHKNAMNALYVDGHVDTRTTFVWTELVK